ncbi:MAG TPA: efflux RND transporter periplasmic adaptor subunit [Thermoanaerobaculia bacterium]
MLLGSCRERPEAVAAEVPALEIKAEVTRPRMAAVVAPYDGRIESVSVAEGGAVKAGDVVAVIANPTVQRDLAYSRAQLALAEYRLRLAQKPAQRATPNDDAKERVRVAQAIVDHRKSRLDRYEKLFVTRDITNDELETARLEYAAARRDLNAERKSLESSQVAAQAIDPALMKLDVDRARAELAVIEDRERQLRVLAPIAGIVTRIQAAPGDSIYPRDPLLEITDASTVEVRGAIAPELLRHVRPGLPVEVKVFTVPPRRFQAQIKTVVPPAAGGGATISVPISNPDGVLQPGTTAIITVR